MIEILPTGCSKGAGVAALLAELGIPPERVMAIGDGENDVEMLRLAGATRGSRYFVPSSFPSRRVRPAALVVSPRRPGPSPWRA